MRKSLLTTTLALGTAAVVALAIAPALADEGRTATGDHCRTAPGAARLPAEAIGKTLEDLGYRVDRVKMDDGCYEARAMNDSGIPIEVRYHPVTGDLVRARLRS
ncbi:PepSY domain-containing protein [Siccirubricoccus sp. G192]|uniref:PepSY domain-containing protein n=1 Tax=Siccirubricoccus sp. G192 TaxID=2849651 RepID=UPI001C2BC925|nr:PepSY domain-containing protein [Siccirubricoccus sp. G192]MBV1796389.1 PepSY domain-containing protein [Siccirubricoccus sp. G192]